MQNLAKHNPTSDDIHRTNQIILKELKKAGIPSVLKDPWIRGEVPTEYEGQYEGFTFKRAWYYWVVKGAVPLEVAKEIHANPNGVEDVRVDGHCCAPPPEEWAAEFDQDTKKMVASDDEWNKGLSLFKDMPDALKNWTENHIPKSKTVTRQSYVLLYHIDTQEGLNWFMDVIRKYKLTGKPT